MNCVFDYDAPRYSTRELCEKLHSFASRPEFSKHSSNAGEWMRKMMRIKDFENMSIADFTQIKQVIDLSCDILRDLPIMKKISTISFVDRLKKKFSDYVVNPVEELELYSSSDVGIISHILFDSFQMCYN